MSDKTLDSTHETASNRKQEDTTVNQAPDSRPQPPPYTPTPAESDALQKHRKRQNAQTAPRLKYEVTGGKTYFKYDHPHPGVGALLLEQALGTADRHFASELVRQLSGLSYYNGKPDEDVLNFLFSTVRGVQPRDEIEALLGAQMAGVHAAIMKALEHFEQAITLPQRETAERMLTRLARTFASLVAALKCYRNGSSK